MTTIPTTRVRHEWERSADRDARRFGSLAGYTRLRVPRRGWRVVVFRVVEFVIDVVRGA